MKTVGEILRQGRLSQGLTIAQLAQSTKIRPDYLQAIEHNHFDKLPSATFVKGFITNYAAAVAVNPGTALAVFRRDFDQNQQGKVVPRGLVKPIAAPTFFWHPRTTAIAASILVVFLILAYTLRQIITFTSAPPLSVLQPENNAHTGNIIEVVGQTDTDSLIMVNNQPVTLDINGNFRTTINLNTGTHTLVIQAQSREGKTRTVTRTITVEP